jgi:hypothetical protein
MAVHRSDGASLNRKPLLIALCHNVIKHLAIKVHLIMRIESPNQRFQIRAAIAIQYDTDFFRMVPQDQA